MIAIVQMEGSLAKCHELIGSSKVKMVDFTRENNYASDSESDEAQDDTYLEERS